MTDSRTFNSDPRMDPCRLGPVPSSVCFSWQREVEEIRGLVRSVGGKLRWQIEEVDSAAAAKSNRRGVLFTNGRAGGDKRLLLAP